MPDSQTWNVSWKGLLDFLDELDLGLLLAFLDEPDLGMLPAFLDEPDLGILPNSLDKPDLKCNEGGIFFEY
ncbi:hypothetical protein RCL_jg29080.t1 [Rhizophagus clarus]|uniref:Uncharacterized protein n=1 Tax=Rhizophagus clarus TaxID=94130 RepID=A0A8H3L1N5_9GLOM|nr:hypothetical protein RCL_jg29080.t1 [Rhizophagus clarus]